MMKLIEKLYVWVNKNTNRGSHVQQTKEGSGSGVLLNFQYCHSEARYYRARNLLLYWNKSKFRAGEPFSE